MYRVMRAKQIYCPPKLFPSRGQKMLLTVNTIISSSSHCSTRLSPLKMAFPNRASYWSSYSHFSFSEITYLAGKKGMFLSLGRIQSNFISTVLLPEKRRLHKRTWAPSSKSVTMPDSLQAYHKYAHSLRYSSGPLHYTVATRHRLALTSGSSIIAPFEIN
jgi:hypothetical protein